MVFSKLCRRIPEDVSILRCSPKIWSLSEGPFVGFGRPSYGVPRPQRPHGKTLQHGFPQLHRWICKPQNLNIQDYVAVVVRLMDKLLQYLTRLNLSFRHDAVDGGSVASPHIAYILMITVSWGA